MIKSFALPDKLRVEVRPLVDVVGERLGDMSAAGILHLLLSEQTGIKFRYPLLVVASLGTTLWISSEWLLRRVNHMKAFHADGQQVPFYLQPTLGGPNACSRGSCSRMTKGRLLQEAKIMTKHVFRMLHGVHVDRRERTASNGDSGVQERR